MASPLSLSRALSLPNSRCFTRQRGSARSCATRTAPLGRSAPLRDAERFDGRRTGSGVCLASRDSAISLAGEALLGLPSVELDTAPNGGYTVTGALEIAAHPEDVYAVLVDYQGAADIFSNIEATQILDVEGKIQLLQKCRWTFLMFSGTFDAMLSVREVPEQKVVLFELVQSSFMKAFEGRWKVVDNGQGGSVVEHSLRVNPTLSPPSVMSGYTRKIFVEQEHQVLDDLIGELVRREQVLVTENVSA